jgi:hypothetical protein
MATAVTEVSSRESVVYDAPRRWRRDLAIGAVALLAATALVRIVLAHARRNSAP